MFCPKCGTQQPNPARSCYKCNAPLPAGRVETNPNLEQPTTMMPQPAHQTNDYPYNQPINQPARPVLSPPPPPAWDMPISNAVNPPASQPYEQPERPKFSYPIEPSGQDAYQPGQYLGNYAPGYVPGSYANPQANWTASNNVTSNRAIASMVCGLLSFLFCPVVTAVVAVILGQMELSAIKQGTAPPAGKSIAQIGLYSGIANLVIFVGFFLLFFLIAIIGAVSS